jgi:L-amino acid N-acyltransferase YncA
MLIRLAQPIDGAAVAEIYRPAVVERATSFELEPPDAIEMSRRITMCLERLPWLVAMDGEEVVGYAYASPHRSRPAYRWSVEVSAYVDPKVQRRGVGRSLYEALFRVLVLQGYRNAYAGVTLPNEASERFHRGVGFTPVGVFRHIGFKLGAWHDVAWLERSLAAVNGAAPAPTIPFALVASSPLLGTTLSGAPTPCFRFATVSDIPAIRTLIDGSVRGLSEAFYSPQQIDSALRYLFGADSQIIADGTYYVAAADGEVIAAGGWSRRQTLHGGDQFKGTDDPLLDPRTEPARIRAFFVDPRWARRGIGRLLFHVCSTAAREAGFRALELTATLPGEPLYRSLGFHVVERDAVEMPDGVQLPTARMRRSLGSSPPESRSKD